MYLSNVKLSLLSTKSSKMHLFSIDYLFEISINYKNRFHLILNCVNMCMIWVVMLNEWIIGRIKIGKICGVQLYQIMMNLTKYVFFINEYCQNRAREI